MSRILLSVRRYLVHKADLLLDGIATGAGFGLAILTLAAIVIALAQLYRVVTGHGWL